MKNTKFIIEKQHAALVEVIQFLDSHGHSDTEVRETVDRILNSRSFDELERESDKEIKQAEASFKISRDIGFDDE